MRTAAHATPRLRALHLRQSRIVYATRPPHAAIVSREPGQSSESVAIA